MKKFSVFLLLFILISCTDKQNFNYDGNVIIDDLGNKFSFTNSPQKIISLAPNITEMIYSLNLEKHLVGNTIYCDYPNEAKNIVKVGDMLTFNFEKIVSLKPDLIFITVEGNTKETYDKFKELGLKVFVSNPRNYEGIKKTYSDISKIFNINSNLVIAKWDSIINKIKISSVNLNKSAMFVVQLSPLMIVGPNTFLNEYLTICGLKNIASDSPLNYPIFNREEIVKRNPDLIIFPTDGSDSIEKIISVYPEWKNLKAIKNNNVIFVDRDLFTRPGPRFVEGVEKLFNQVHQSEATVQNH
ncbi:MAG: helical backbone metal receptor [Melioribacteraceae bacterium]|nr:helical backbone metal receptor [Melioribacteraceae bacterium]